MLVREFIKNLLIGLIQKKFGILPEFLVAVPENPEHGDYSTNAALVLAKSLKKSPIEVAKEVADILVGQLKGWKIEIAGPGFINFWMSEDFLQKEFGKILREKENYGKGKRKKQKVQVEFVSANPTGPLTLANGRGGFWGDTLSNTLKFSGYPVEREYYINDTGNQIITLGKSILSAVGLIPGEENFYKGEYIKKWARGNRRKVKKFKSNPLGLGQEAAKDFLADIKRGLIKAKIAFDRFTSEEKDLHQKNFVKKALAVLQKSGKVFEKEGATWLKTTDFADDKDRVLLTSDGFPTYFLADAGHYLETKTRGFSAKINILGPDHFGYVKRIQAAGELLGFKNSQIIITQTVRLVRGGKEVKMSKRKGEFVTFADLLKEVGPEMARYFFLEKSPDSHLDFDLDLAKKRSSKNPVYYIQYAHTRAASILRKTKNPNPKLQIADCKLLKEAEELRLIKKLIQFSEIVEDTANDYQVHRIPRFALELARIFHHFYEKHRVVTGAFRLTKARLSLVFGTRIILKSLLGLMGMVAPEKM